MHIKELNLNQIWQDSFGWHGDNVNPRKFDDNIEREFWVKMAPEYTQKYNMNSDSPLMAECLQKIIEPGSTVLEIGPGSGNFTVLIAEYAGKILGVDMAPAMLYELEQRAKENNYQNIELVNDKWEDYIPQEKYDYVISVNSLYRIPDMENALMKMYNYSKKGVILLRTIQRPFFYDLYKKLNLICAECLDYQLLPMYFWQHDIHANVEFLDYTKKKNFSSWEWIEKELVMDLGVSQYIARKDDIMTELESILEKTSEGLCFTQSRTTVVTAVKK